MSLLLRLNAASATTQFGSASVVATGPASGRTGSVVLPRTPRTTGPYVAAQYSSFQGDGGNDGSAITTGATLPGDQLFVTVTDSQSNTAPTAPAGWSEVFVSDTDQGTNFENHFYLLNNPASSTTYTWTVVGGRRTITGLLVRGGVYENGDTLETATSTSHLSPTVVSQGPDRLAVAILVNRAFPTCAWTENQAGSWDERIQTVGGDGVTNMQVSAQNKPVGPGAVSDTFLCANSEPAIIGLFIFGAGPGGRGIPVVPAQPLPKLAGTATILASRTDPAAAAQDFPPRTIILLATTRTPAGAALVLPRFDSEDVAPPRQAVVTAVRPPQPPGGAQVLAPHTDITPDTPCPAPILSAGRAAAILPGVALLTGSRTDPLVAGTNACPQPTITAGRPPALAGSTVLAGPRTDPTPDTLTPQTTVVPGRPGPLSGSTALLGPRTDPTPATAMPQPTVVTGRPTAQPAGVVALTTPRTDPTGTTPDAPCPVPVIAARPIAARAGSTVLARPATDPTPDTPVPQPAVAAGRPAAQPAGATVLVYPRTDPTPATLTPEPVISPTAVRAPAAAATSTVLRSTFTTPGLPGDTIRPPLVVTAGRRLIAAGAVLFGRLTHSCTTPRPSTGSTTRPGTGTTAYNLGTTGRPNTGTTSRPNTGTTQEPC